MAGEELVIAVVGLREGELISSEVFLAVEAVVEGEEGSIEEGADQEALLAEEEAVSEEEVEVVVGTEAHELCFIKFLWFFIASTSSEATCHENARI